MEPMDIVADEVQVVKAGVVKVGGCAARLVLKVFVSVYPQGNVMVATNGPAVKASGVKDTLLPLLEMPVCVQPAGACQVILYCETE